MRETTFLDAAPRGTHKKERDANLLSWYPQNVRNVLTYTRRALVNDMVHNLGWSSGKTACNTYKESIKEAILQANTALNESMYLVLTRTLFTNILVEVQLTHKMETVVRLPFSFPSSSCPFFVDMCFRFLKSQAMCTLKLSNMQKNMRKGLS